MRFDLYAEYSISRVKTQVCFIDQPVYRCEVLEIKRLFYFFEIFYCNFHYHKRLVQKFMNISVKHNLVYKMKDFKRTQ